MSYSVKLENFEGPLDLLLFLVRKNELDIQEIPIVLITRQYIEYLEIMKALNLDIAGEFLVMAATLLYLKSRALLPKTDDDEPEEESTLEDLKRQLLEYQQYKDAALRLKEQSILDKDVFTRAAFTEPVPAGEEEILQEVSLFDLLAAFKNILERSDKKEDVLEVTVEEISIKDTMNDIMQRLLEVKEGLEFTLLFSQTATKMEIITTLLALLELMKIQAIKVYQNMNFSNIYIYPVENEDEKENNTNDEQLLERE